MSIRGWSTLTLYASVQPHFRKISSFIDYTFFQILPTEQENHPFLGRSSTYGTKSQPFPGTMIEVMTYQQVLYLKQDPFSSFQVEIKPIRIAWKNDTFWLHIPSIARYERAHPQCISAQQPFINVEPVE